MDYESAMDYYIVLDKGKEVYGTNSEKYIRDGTLIKYYDSSGGIDSVWLGKGSWVIGSYVDADKTNFDSTFILVAQKPLDSICECNLSCFKEMPSYDKRSYPRCKDALERSTFYQYWIINKVQDAIYGPFTKAEYLQKREELGVPEELQIKEKNTWSLW